MTPGRPLLLHVGYHKTATTWMQRALFQEVHGYRPLLSHAEVFDLVVRPHGLRWDPAPARALIAERLAGVPGGQTPVISSEILSGLPFTGGRESDGLARRLAEVAEGLPAEPRILVSIRAQMRMLPSVYMQYIRRGGTMPPETFFAGESEIGYFGFSPEHFEYDRFVALYQRLFGRAAVHVRRRRPCAATWRGPWRTLPASPATPASRGSPPRPAGRRARATRSTRSGCCGA